MVQKLFANPSRHVATTRIMRGLPQRSRSGNTTRSNKKQPSSETTKVLVSSNDAHHQHHNHASGTGGSTGVSGTEWDIYSYNGESVNKDAAGSSIIFMGDDWSLPTGISPAPREDHPLDTSTIAESDIYTSCYDCYDDQEDDVGGEEEKEDKDEHQTEERQNHSVTTTSRRETIPLNISFTYSVEEDQDYDNTSYNNNKDDDGEECRGYEKQEEKYDTIAAATTTALFQEDHFDVGMDINKMFDITLVNNAKVETEQQGANDVVLDRQSSNVAEAATEDSTILLVEEKEEEWVTKTKAGAESIANHGGGGKNSSTQEGVVRGTIVAVGSKQEDDMHGVSTGENLVEEGTWIQGGGASEQPTTLEEDEISV